MSLEVCMFIYHLFFHYSNSSPTHPVEPLPLGSDVSVRGCWLAGGPSGSVAMLSLLSLTHSTCSPQPLSRMPSSGCTATASHSSADSSPASRVSIVELGSRLALGPLAVSRGALSVNSLSHSLWYDIFGSTQFKDRVQGREVEAARV